MTLKETIDWITADPKREARLRECMAARRRRVDELLVAADPFARAYRVSMQPFGHKIDQADGISHWLPGGWPSVEEIKKLNDIVVEMTRGKQ